MAILLQAALGWNDNARLFPTIFPAYRQLNDLPGSTPLKHGHNLLALPLSL